MRRRTFDLLSISVGGFLAIVLAIAGGLMLWGANFGLSQVRDNLADQQIVFPAADSPALQALPAADADAMRQYAGQPLTTGAQAEVYADHFIKIHLGKVAAGKTYAQVSTELQGMKSTDPNYATVSGQRTTLFQGETLRGLLLEAYGFSVFASVALYAGMASLVGAAFLLVLVGLGIRHWRRTPEDATIWMGHQAAA